MRFRGWVAPADPNLSSVEWVDSAAALRLRPVRRARAAFDRLVALLDRSIQDRVLRAGDYVALNNHRVVHGRRPFTAHHDGTDRWLKRVSVSNDLRRSRELRGAATSRPIG